MSNWWAEKLAAVRGPTPQPQAPPVYRQITSPHQQPYVQPQMAPQVPVDGAQKLDNVSFTDALALAEQGVLVSRGDPRGAAKFDTDHCPECGSNNFFKRSNASGRGASAGGRVLNTSTGQMVHAAPLCMDCGFRGGVIPMQTGELYDAPPAEG